MRSKIIIAYTSSNLIFCILLKHLLFTGSVFDSCVSSQLNCLRMDKFIGFFRTVSFLLFLAALLWSYANISGQVTYSFNNLNEASAYLDKDMYFFVSLGVFILVNAVVGFFIQTIKKVKTVEDGKGFKNITFKQDITTWFKGFAAVVNIFFSLILFYLGLVNLAESQQSFTMGFYIYLGPILILLWFFYLAWLLGKSRV